MADGDSTCAHCGGKVPPIITKLGNVSEHVRAYCSARCKQHASYARRRLKAGKPPKKGQRVEKPCAHCGSVMSLMPAKASITKFCSRECTNAARRTGSIERPCDICGTIYQPIRTKGGLVAGRTDGRRHDVFSRHCSRECGYIASSRTRSLQALIRSEIDALRRIRQTVAKGGAELIARTRAKVRVEIASLRKIGRHFMQRIPCHGGPKVARLPCRACGAQLIIRRKRGAIVCEDCQTATKRKWKRIYKAKRRAITRGAHAELIDPLRVFARDRWRCQHCGCKTPPKKRGTIEPDAPELDHIISLAEGGTHTWANVQCLCRKCNMEKGATSRGQLHMFAA